ncbi:S35F4 protein, partial [Polypterus senegalus]
MPRVPAHLRERALGMLQGGMRTADVARAINCHVRTVRRLRQRYRETGRTADHPRSGRARISIPLSTSGTCWIAGPGMRRLSDHSPRRLSDISSQLRQLRYLTVEDPIKEELKSSRSFLDVNSALNDLSTVEIVAAILSITGIVMMAYADGFHSDSIIGVALAVGSASSSALYKVTFNLLVNFGIALTYPTLISVGVFLSVPVNSAVDLCLQTTEEFSKVRLAATGIIGLGFLLLLLPEEWDETALRCIERIKRDRQREESPEDGDESGVVTRGKSKMAVLT